MSKTEADWCKKIEIWWLLKSIRKSNSIVSNLTIWWGDNGINGSITAEVTIQSDRDKYVRFMYSQTNEDTGEDESVDYKVPLIETPCNYGGTRYWFQCPLIRDGKTCSRRVGVLYKAGIYFGCRHCYQLTYNSRNENKRVYESNPILTAIGFGIKMEKLEETAKRFTYKGKPTKKRQKIEKLHNKTLEYLEKAGVNESDLI